VPANTGNRCATHRVERAAPRARGYDAAHRARRATIQQRIDSGAIIRCATCSKRLRGRAWDLGHAPDRSKYIGPQCQRCNRSEGGARGAAHTNSF
jgi:hypothetical protein